MRNIQSRAALLRLAWWVALALSLALSPVPAAAQGGTSPQTVVTSLSSAVDAIQARLDADDPAGARLAYRLFEDLWHSVEHVVRGTAGGTSRDVEHAMADLHNAIFTSTTNPGRARAAIAALRGQLTTFALLAGVTPPTFPAASTPSAATAPLDAAASAPAAATSAPAAASATAPSTAVSVEECARYAGRAAQPYFEYAQTLVDTAPLPGIPPAQVVTPQYAYGRGPLPGSGLMGPARPIYPYPGRFGPGAIMGGVGLAPSSFQLTAPGLTNVFQAGGQLPALPNGALPALAPSDLIALGSNQSADLNNAIGLGGLQQSVLTNQLGFSTLRYNWVQTFLQLSEQARDLALLHCGRIP
jgi:hypothetical protein